MSGGGGATAGGGASGNGGMSMGGASGGGPANTCTLHAPVAFSGQVLSDFLVNQSLKVAGVGKGGSWMSDTDGTGTIKLELDPEKGALHFTGSNHTGWGGDMAAMLIDATSPVDVSRFSSLGMHVWGTVTGGALYAKLQNPDSLVAGCGCDPSPLAANTVSCYGGYIQQASVAPEPGGGQSLLFDSFDPSPFGYHKYQSIDPTQLLNVALVVQNLGASVSWDLYIGDMRFM
jgi:hypothetical protein